MNFLCHFHLAGDDPGLIIGGLLGDHIKGPLRGEWPETWEQGIKLHRKIDALTDNHPSAHEFILSLPASYRRFAPIMLDVCFDHCIANHWQRYHSEPLPEFAQKVYQLFEPTLGDLPKNAAHHMERLTQFDVLTGSTEWSLIERMLTAIDTRFKKDTPLAHCQPTLKARLPDIERLFHQIYPEIDRQLLNYRPSVINGAIHGQR